MRGTADERPPSPRHHLARLRVGPIRNAKLNWELAEEIRQRRKTTAESYPVLGRAYGVSQSTIHLLVKGKTWVIPGQS